MAATAAAKSLQSCPTLCNPRDNSPTRLPHPWDSPGKNTGVGCHFLLQCIKVKSESEVTQLCLTLSDPMDCSPPGSSNHGIFQARVLEWGAIAFSNVMEESKIKPQKTQISVHSLCTLNDFQKLIGDINWLRPSIGLPTYALQNLFKILEGPPDPNSPRQLTKEAKELKIVEKCIQHSFSTRLHHTQPVYLYIFPTKHSPTAIIAQNSPIEWVYLHIKQSKKIISYIEKIGQLIVSGRSHVQTLTGFDPYAIHVPLTKKELRIALQYNMTMQIALSDFQNVISFHLPKGKLWNFLQFTKFIVTNIIVSQPISNAPTYFIDGNKKGIAGIVGPDIKEKLPTTYSSVQRVELYALYALLCLQPLSFNVYTDSKYLASLFPDFVTAFLYNIDEELYILFSKTQTLI